MKCTCFVQDDAVVASLHAFDCALRLQQDEIVVHVPMNTQELLSVHYALGRVVQEGAGVPCDVPALMRKVEQSLNGISALRRGQVPEGAEVSGEAEPPVDQNRKG